MLEHNNYNIPSKDMNGPSQWSLRDHVPDDNTKLHVHQCIFFGHEYPRIFEQRLENL